MSETNASVERWFIGGRLSLDLAATLRFRCGTPVDLLRQPKDLVDWFVAVRGVHRPPEVSSGDLEDARTLREALYRLASASRLGKPWTSEDVRLVNRFAAIPTPIPTLSAEQFEWRNPEGVKSLLAEVARDGVELVAGSEARYIRECANPRCTRLFVDKSRSRNRRWCSMKECGNRAKAASHRRRGGSDPVP